MKKIITIEYDPRICPMMDKAIAQTVQNQYEKRVVAGKIGSRGAGNAEEFWYIEFDSPEGVKDDGHHIFSVQYGPGYIRDRMSKGFSTKEGVFCSIFVDERPYLYINGRKVVSYEEEICGGALANRLKYVVEGLERPYTVFRYELINNKSYNIAVQHILLWKEQKGFRGELY